MDFFVICCLRNLISWTSISKIPNVLKIHLMALTKRYIPIQGLLPYLDFIHIKYCEWWNLHSLSLNFSNYKQRLTNSTQNYKNFENSNSILFINFGALNAYKFVQKYLLFKVKLSYIYISSFSIYLLITYIL